MYHHVKKLMYTVALTSPTRVRQHAAGAVRRRERRARRRDAVFHSGTELRDPERKDLLMDIGTEELSHLEIVGALARLHLKPMKFDREAAEADPLIAIAGGGGVNLYNSMGNAWTADYLKITGELDVDLRSNIAAEARAKIVYERLINFTDDAGTKDALQFLMTREITHMKAFTAALESMGKPRFSIGKIPPTPGLVDQFFNDSTGDGRGRRDRRARSVERGRRLAVSSRRRRSRRSRRQDAADGVVDRRPQHQHGRETRRCSQELLVEQLRTCCMPKGSWSRRCRRWPRRRNRDAPAASRSRSISRRPRAGRAAEGGVRAARRRRRRRSRARAWQG